VERAFDCAEADVVRLSACFTMAGRIHLGISMLRRKAVALPSRTISPLFRRISSVDRALEELENKRQPAGDEHPDRVALVFRSSTGTTESISYVDRTLEELKNRRSTLGDNHPETLMTMSDLATSMKGRGKFTSAEALHRGVARKAEARARKSPS
jgi:GTPase